MDTCDILSAVEVVWLDQWWVLRQFPLTIGGCWGRLCMVMWWLFVALTLETAEYLKSYKYPEKKLLFISFVVSRVKPYKYDMVGLDHHMVLINPQNWIFLLRFCKLQCLYWTPVIQFHSISKLFKIYPWKSLTGTWSIMFSCPWTWTLPEGERRQNIYIDSMFYYTLF